MASHHLVCFPVDYKERVVCRVTPGGWGHGGD